MFDMLTGSPPFSADSKLEVQDQILRGRISQPTGVSAEAKDLLKNLLKRNHATRLGGGEGDALEVQVSATVQVQVHIFHFYFQRHSWFREIDWFKLERKELPVLYKPPISGPEDVSLFDHRFANMSISYESPTSTPAGNGNIFQDFSYQGTHTTFNLTLCNAISFLEEPMDLTAYQTELKRRRKLKVKSVEPSQLPPPNGDASSTNGRQINGHRKIQQ